MPEGVRQIIERLRRHNLPDRAAALTYYTLLALFPTVIVLVSIIGLFGDPGSTTETVSEMVGELGPKSAVQTFKGPIQSLTENRSAAGILLLVGLVTALWSASAYISAFRRASNVIYERQEEISAWKLRPLQLLLTLAMVVIAAIAAMALVLTGPIVEAIADPIGVGNAAVDIWRIAKWPVLVLLIALLFGVLYAITTPVGRDFRWISAGSGLAVLIWLVASASLAFYVANFGSYDATYGSLGGLVVMLLWIWVTNLALLLGVELNAARDPGKQETAL